MFDPYVVRFRKKAESKGSPVKAGIDIIARSTSKVEVTIEGKQNAIPVIFINDSKESGTEAILYSYIKDGVQLGNYITYLGDSYLVYQEIKNLKQPDYVKVFKLVLCNVTFSFNGSTIKTYFRGSLRSVQSEESNLAQRLGIESLGEAFIITPSSYSLRTNDYFKINDKGWRITYLDNTTNPGITYSGLEEYIITDTEKTSVNEVELLTPQLMSVEEFFPELKSGLDYSFDTEEGYISFDKKIKIISRTLNSIKINIPFGIDDVTISIKKNGEIVSTYYKVRL